MNKPITKPRTLSGRYFPKKDLILVQQTVKSFPNLSLTELAFTLCEHLSWVTPKGRNKIQSCLTALEKLDKEGYIQLPKKRQQKRRETKKIARSPQTEAPATIDCSLDALDSIECLPVEGKSDVALWNEYVDRYHYLGYKHPIGATLKYFIVAKLGDQPIIMGCLLFSGSVWHLSDRDQWIDWTKEDREKRLNLVINNTRFLIFPWVNVANLASKALSIVSQRIQNDWQTTHGYRPVLIETFVDSSRYSGACYQAANWQRIGMTTGKVWNEVSVSTKKQSEKYIFVHPLQTNFKAILKNQKPNNEPIKADEQFITLWGQVVVIIADVAYAFDQTWQKRKRVIDSLLLVFLIFRLVFSKNSQGYGTTIAEFWGNCHRMKFPLPQKKPISASSFSDARKKLDESIFNVLNKCVIEACEVQDDTPYLWHGHRLFGVDGSKLNLPRTLLDYGYKTPSDEAHYPQGLLSCLYQLKSKIPYDFNLVNHANERLCALEHLKTLHEKDVVVYDRGYFSYALLYYHLQSGVFPVFRLQKNTFKAIDDFRKGDETDQVVTLLPLKDTRRNIKRDYPDIDIVPLNIRLVKYTLAGETYCIGTTLMDQHYRSEDFQSVYHERWGIEELYKISKQMVEVDDFHGRCERTVKQELFAHFVLITMSRVCSNESESMLANLLNPIDEKTGEAQIIRVNFKHSLTTISRHLEEFMFVSARGIKMVIDEIVNSISCHRQKIRPNRSYIRKSMLPIGKWRGCKAKT